MARSSSRNALGNDTRTKPDAEKLTTLQWNARLDKLVQELIEATRDEMESLHGEDGAAAFDGMRKLETARKELTDFCRQTRERQR